MPETSHLCSFPRASVATMTIGVSRLGWLFWICFYGPLQAETRDDFVAQDIGSVQRGAGPHRASVGLKPRRSGLIHASMGVGHGKRKAAKRGFRRDGRKEGGLEDAVRRLVASGFPEAEARRMLGLPGCELS